MQEYTISGRILVEPVNTRYIEPGMLGLILKDGKYYRVTALHVNQDRDWVVSGDYNGVINELRPILRFIAFTNAENFPIGFKDWDTIIKHELMHRPAVSFIIKPHKFKPGNFNQTCSECNCSFQAAKSQPYCTICCNKLAIAYLHGDVVKKNNNFDKKAVREIANTSYQMGVLGTTEIDFANWLETKVEPKENNHEKKL